MECRSKDVNSITKYQMLGQVTVKCLIWNIVFEIYAHLMWKDATELISWIIWPLHWIMNQYIWMRLLWTFLPVLQELPEAPVRKSHYMWWLGTHRSPWNDIGRYRFRLRQLISSHAFLYKKSFCVLIKVGRTGERERGEEADGSHKHLSVFTKHTWQKI